MKKNQKYCGLFALVLLLSIISSFKNQNIFPAKGSFKFPYKAAGLTEREAAAHLISRFTFGARPGQVNEIVKIGLENWFLQQLQAGLPEDDLNRRLANYKTLNLSNAQLQANFPKNAEVLRMAIRDGVIDKNAVEKDAADKDARQAYRAKLGAYMREKGLQPQQDLFRELVNQKILRATYAQNQLQESLTSFWFNHFNVSLTDNDCAIFIPNYERDVIRPNVLNSFENLLLATAKSPAMLTYLDNFRSTATNTNMGLQVNQRPNRNRLPAGNSMAPDSMDKRSMALQKIKNARNAQGINENYAREIMELHTLGVDGGYTQADVTQAARVFTGWTIIPQNRVNAPLLNAVNRPGRGNNQMAGATQEGDFIFLPNRHDSGEKVVLGEKFPAGGGYEEGVRLIKILANHPATAQFICTKLAVRFVSDNPSPTLISKMARTFREKNGDLKQVLMTMTTAPEFWSKEALREKTKSPFELAISSVRSLDAEVQAPYQLYNWINKMGEKMYAYQAPTGFPDQGTYWINTGSLLNRMNFGLALAAQRIPGIKINLAALNQNREPESAEAALFTYSQYLMPERNLTETVKRLTPALNDPELSKKVSQAADKLMPPSASNPMAPDTTMISMVKQPKAKEKISKKNITKNKTEQQMQAGAGNNTMLAQVVGIIIGSPEFQRR